MKKKILILLTIALLPALTLVGCTGGAAPQSSSLSTTTAPQTTLSTEDPTTPEEEGGVDLVLFIGQSNMAGRGTARSATRVKEGHAYEFRAISDPTKLYPLEEPFGVNENNPTSGVNENKKTGSMVSAFCESYYAATGRPIVAVSCSKGGEKISFFDKGGKAYEDACARVKSAQAFLEQEYASGNTAMKLRATYVVWLQGESDGDAGTTASAYTRTLSRIVNGFRADIGAAQTFIIPIGTYNGNNEARKANYTAIRDAQIAYCEGNANATVISRQLLDIFHYGYMKDEFHFKQEGYEIVGKDAGTNMGYFVMTGEKPTCKEYAES